SAPSGSGFSGGASGSGSSITGTLTNTTNGTVTATYTVTPTSGTCTGTTFTVTVTLDPKPVISAMATETCGGTQFTVSPVNVTNGIVPDGTTYTWSAPSGTGFTGGTAGTDQTDIFGTLMNTTNGVVTATYTVTPTIGSCTGSTFTVTVTLDPKPVISAMATETCGGTQFTVSPVNVTNGIVPDGTTYTWSAPSGTGFTGGAAGTDQTDIFGTLMNTTNGVVTATYTVTPTAGTCTGSSFTVTVTLDPKPVISAMATETCGGTQFTVSPVNVTNGIVPDGITYSWSAPSGTGFTGGAAGTDQTDIFGTLMNTTNGVVTATYTVTPTAGTCTGNTFTVTVTLDPKPVISAMATETCGGTQFIVSPVNVTNGIIPDGTTYSWSAPSGTGFSGGVAGSGSNISGTLMNTTNAQTTATYTVTPTAGSCTGSPFTVTVTLDPTPAITAMNTTICGGSQFTVTPVDGDNGIVPSGTSYSWFAPSGTGFTGGAAGTDQTDIFGTLMNTTNGVVTATYTVTPTAGTCTGSAFTVTVTLDPKPVISAMATETCGGVQFTVTPVDGVNGIVPSGTSYSWSAPSGSGFSGGVAGSGSSITGTLINTTNAQTTATYTVTPTAGSCTGATFIVTDTLDPTPYISAMATETCGNVQFTVTPVNSVNGIVPSGTSYSWSAPSGSGFTGGVAGSGSSITGTLMNTTNTQTTATYTVTPTAGTCTGNPFTVTVTLDPTPAITAMNTTICGGSQFTVTPVDGDNGIVPSGTSYSWSAPSGTGFSGGAAGSGSSITGTLTNMTNGTVTATYTVTPTAGSCTGATFTLTVTLVPKPDISAMATETCGGVQFTVTPVDGVNGIVPSGTSYSWSAPSGSGFSGGIAGSGSSITGTLINTTNAQTTATYTVTPTAGSCTGSTFTVTVTLDPTPYISAMATETCGNVQFTVTPVNSVNGIVPSGTSYSWSAPSGSGFSGGVAGSGSSITGTLMNTTNTQTTATYTVTPTAGSCTGSPFTVTVTLDPTPAITAMNATVCGGSQFTVTPVDGDNGIVPSGTSYSWSAPSGSGFSGGAAGSGSSITGILINTTNAQTTATYTVTPTAGSCTGSTFTVTVTLNPTPYISAMATETCGDVQFTVTPVNSVNGIVPSGTSYSWSAPSGSGFTGGAAGSGSSITGTLTNTTNGTVTAIYTVTPTAGTCTDGTFMVTVTVYPTATADQVSNFTYCKGVTTSEIDFTSPEDPATSYAWTNNNTSIGLAASGSGNILPFTTTNMGTSPIFGTITVTPTAYGCVGTPMIFTITVTPIPTATISYAGTPFCTSIVTPQPVTLNGTGAYTGGTYSAASGLTLDATTGDITPSTSAGGTYEVTYTIPASGGCSSV
ncbi:MAG: PKD-like domain-containing protein, partial [Bacteroidales bacterium]